MTKGYAAIGLDNPKCIYNLGGVMRAASCYNADLVIISGTRMQRTATDVTKHWLNSPVLQTDNLHKLIPFDCVPIAVELLPSAQNLIHYKHPTRAFYIFGGEDNTLGTRITSWCRDIIYIPTSSCMNLAATVNVILYDRMAKQT